MSSIISVNLVAAAKKSADIPREIPEAALQEAAQRYEKFLLLIKENFGKGLAPSKDIDMMWHLHMLQPRRYYEDCMSIFGKILDHDGGFGSVPEEVDGLMRAFEMTSNLWLKKYGTPYVTPGKMALAPAENIVEDKFNPIKQCRDVCAEQCSTNCH